MMPHVTTLLFVCTVSQILPQSLSFSVCARRKTRHAVKRDVRQMASGGNNDSDMSMQRPPPRRTLKKRKNKRRERMDRLFRKSDNTIDHNDDEYEIETRPVRRRDAVEAGLDYWMDENDMERERQRKIAIKNRKALEGEISRDKLRKEMVAPYKQNWIGVFSLVIVMLSAIVTKFPELMQIPVIQIPDL